MGTMSSSIRLIRSFHQRKYLLAHNPIYFHGKRYQQQPHYMQHRNNYVTYGTQGMSFGSALAICISYTHYRSVLWACIHGCCSWLYVGYFVLTGGTGAMYMER